VPKLFSNEQFNRWLDDLGIYKVAREIDGTPVAPGRVQVEE
jgi:hypothetical protein